MRARGLIILSIFLSNFLMKGQVDSVYTGSAAPPPVKKNIFSDGDWMKNFIWGGNFQAWVGNPTFVFLSPTIGYVPVKNLNVGIGGIYNYTSIRTSYGKFEQSIFGGHSYARYIIAESYFVQAQFDKLYQPDWYSFDPEAKRWVDYILVGGGIRQQIADRAAIITSIMYNLKPDPLSIYPGRVIVQFGIVAGF